MNEQTLKAYLSDHPWASLVRCADSTGSTNADVKALASAGAPEGTAVIAGQQREGRGRLGRSFFSPADSGLYLSVLLRPQRSAAELLDLTARAAVCAQRAIKAACGIEVDLKWVNDLFLNGKKVGGILTELTGGASPAVTLGIGINCTQTAFPPELADIAGSLAGETGLAVDRAALAAALLRQFSGIFEIDWLSDYRKSCITLGKQVRIISAQGEKDAFALDVTPAAALRVQYPDGSMEEIASGEVSVRNRI